MAPLIPEEIEHYISAHTTPQGELLERLRQETQARMANPGMMVGATEGRLLTIPNKLLTKEAVANFSHRRDMELRVRIRLGLTPTWGNVTKAEEIVKDIAKNHPDICQEKPKPPEAVLRDFGDQDVIMEIRYYVANPKKMRSSKSFFVTEILRRFGEEKVTLAFPVRINMNSDVKLEDLGF